ncbi:MAG TPA: geranylgeranylglyceryl/heptaprenylglyceryl phosphate synthase [Gemmatimonadales bacterium]|nr:geranylgeranylglyceryl/heptaprenylglyceryl phosphate synthase [Gemmatimonadales bacterium]
MSSVLERLCSRTGLCVLVDPDRTEPDASCELAASAESAGAAALLIGTSFDGSARTGAVAAAMKRACRLPVLLFPGSAGQLVPDVDAVLLLSLVSGRNPQYLIEEHVRSVPFFQKHPVQTISTAYILVDGGRVTAVEAISQTRPLPADKPEIAVAHAQAARMIGMAAVYLDSGSGAERPVAPELIGAVRRAVRLPLFVGGGMRTAQQVAAARAAGADFVVVGNAIEAAGPGAIGELVAAAATPVPAR